MSTAVRDTSADATRVRGHIPAEEQLVDPVAEPEISMTAAHAPGAHHHSRRHPDARSGHSGRARSCPAQVGPSARMLRISGRHYWETG
jgi:hypothetical protein